MVVNKSQCYHLVTRAGGVLFLLWRRERCGSLGRSKSSSKLNDRHSTGPHQALGTEMKEATKPAYSSAERPEAETAEAIDFGNRKLVRPTLARELSESHIDERHNRQASNGQKKASPPEQTHAE